MSSSMSRMIRFFGQVTVTGDAAGATKPFWNALANSQRAFEIIVGIPTHYTLMVEKKINMDSLPVDKTDQLAEWIKSLDPEYTNLLGVCLGWRDQVHPSLQNEHFKELLNKISSMGIDPWELTALPNSTLTENESRKGTLCFRRNKNDVFASDLIRDIKTVINQRVFICNYLANQK